MAWWQRRPEHDPPSPDILYQMTLLADRIIMDAYQLRVLTDEVAARLDEADGERGG